MPAEEIGMIKRTNDPLSTWIEGNVISLIRLISITLLTFSAAPLGRLRKVDLLKVNEGDQTELTSIHHCLFLALFPVRSRLVVGTSAPPRTAYPVVFTSYACRKRRLSTQCDNGLLLALLQDHNLTPISTPFLVIIIIMRFNRAISPRQLIVCMPGTRHVDLPIDRL